MKTIDLVCRRRLLILLFKNVKALLFIINALCIWKVDNKPFINLNLSKINLSNLKKDIVKLFYNEEQGWVVFAKPR